MKTALPTGLLCDLHLPPLSAAADEELRRIRVFLASLHLPGWRTVLALAGYSPEQHRTGVFVTSLLSGERSFAEWRLWRSLRPPRDPDLPELVARLRAFSERWLPRARAAARSAMADPEDRDEILDCLDDETLKRSSETWQAKVVVGCLRRMADGSFYEPVWKELEAAGFTDELPAFDHTLGCVQEFIRSAPLDAGEIEEMGRAREEAVSSVRRWLDERREQLRHLDEADLGVLALGPVVPPPGFEPPISLLSSLWTLSADAPS